MPRLKPASRSVDWRAPSENFGCWEPESPRKHPNSPECVLEVPISLHLLIVAPPKRRSGGRTTPKGTRPNSPRQHETESDDSGVSASSRYTPPVPNYMKQSPTWVPVLMFALFIVGTLVILLYYLGAVPGGRSNVYLLVGLAAILGGLYTATKYH